VLSELEEIKVAVGYKYNGVALSTFPASLNVREDSDVVLKASDFRTDTGEGGSCL